MVCHSYSKCLWGLKIWSDKYHMHKTVLVDLVMFETLYFSRQKQNSCLQRAKQHDFIPVIFIKSHYIVQDRYIYRCNIRNLPTHLINYLWLSNWWILSLASNIFVLCVIIIWHKTLSVENIGRFDSSWLICWSFIHQKFFLANLQTVKSS